MLRACVHACLSVGEGGFFCTCETRCDLVCGCKQEDKSRRLCVCMCACMHKLPHVVQYQFNVHNTMPLHSNELLIKMKRN